MKIRLFRYCQKVFSHDYDERRRPSKGRPRGGFRDGKCKNLLAPLCLGKVLRRGALPNFYDFHGLGANTLFIPVFTDWKEPKKVHADLPPKYILP